MKLNKDQLGHLLIFLNRVELKGIESPQFIEIYQWVINQLNASENAR